MSDAGESSLSEIPREPLPPAVRARSQWPVALVSGAIGAGMSLAFFDLAWPAVRPVFDAVGLLPLSVAVMMAAVLAILGHEVGHLVGGRLVGFRFMMLVVGPVWLDRLEGRLRWRLNRNLAMAGGMALSVPPDRERLAGRFAVMVAAGPVMSWVMGGLVVVAAVLPEGGSWMPVVRVFLGALGGISILLGLVTRVPVPMGGSPG